MKKIAGSTSKWPIATCLLIITCVAVFAFQAVYPEEALEGYAFVPAKAWSRPWTFITSIFLHANLDHLMFNLLGLAFFGYAAEIAMGRKSLLIVFFSVGILSGFGSMVMIPHLAYSMGASGAILGILGFLAITRPFYPVRFLTPFYDPVILYVIFYCIGDLVYLFTSTEQISYGGHLVGLITGASLGILWRASGKLKSGGFELNS